MKKFECVICHKKYEYFNLTCSKKCAKELAHMIAVVGAAYAILNVIGKVKT